MSNRSMFRNTSPSPVTVIKQAKNGRWVKVGVIVHPKKHKFVNEYEPWVVLLPNPARPCYE